MFWPHKRQLHLADVIKFNNNCTLIYIWGPRGKACNLSYRSTDWCSPPSSPALGPSCTCSPLSPSHPSRMLYAGVESSFRKHAVSTWQETGAKSVIRKASRSFAAFFCFGGTVQFMFEFRWKSFCSLCLKKSLETEVIHMSGNFCPHSPSKKKNVCCFWRCANLHADVAPS